MGRIPWQDHARNTTKSKISAEQSQVIPEKKEWETAKDDRTGALTAIRLSLSSEGETNMGRWGPNPGAPTLCGEGPENTCRRGRRLKRCQAILQRALELRLGAKQPGRDESAAQRGLMKAHRWPRKARLRSYLPFPRNTTLGTRKAMEAS